VRDGVTDLRFDDLGYGRFALDAYAELTRLRDEGVIPAGWTERAAAELRSSGETVRRTTTGAPVELAPQELQIARFVIEGASNRDVPRSSS
jgi:hypothetical protein